MNNFQCYNVVDGDTFDVTPSWLYQGTSGPRVRIANVNAPELRQPGDCKPRPSWKTPSSASTSNCMPARSATDGLLPTSVSVS